MNPIGKNIKDVSDFDLMVEYKKRYAQSHPLEKNIHHNIYICKSVDKNGNITDVKYGMNALTDWGLFILLTNQPLSRPTEQGGTDYRTIPYLTRRLDGINDNWGGFSYILFGETDDSNSVSDQTPPTASETFNNPFGTSSSFNITNRYNSATDEGYQDFQNGVMTATCKVLDGYYDYNVSDENESTYSRDAELDHIGIFFKFRPYYNWTTEILICNSYIYNEFGEKSTIMKSPNEKLYITIYATAIMDPDIMNRLWNKKVYGVFNPLAWTQWIFHSNVSDTEKMYVNWSKPYKKYDVVYSHRILQSTEGGTHSATSCHWQSLNRELEIQWGEQVEHPNTIPSNWNDLPLEKRLEYWYGSEDISPRTEQQRQCWVYNDRMPVDKNDIDLDHHQDYAFLLDTGVVLKTTGGSDETLQSKLLEEWDDVVSRISITDAHEYHWDSWYNRTYDWYTFRFLLQYYPQLPTSETLCTHRAYTTSVYEPTFSKNTYGEQRDIYSGNGAVCVSNFNITSLKRYNFFTQQWDINEPFETHPENMYDEFTFKLKCGMKIMIDGTVRNVSVYTNSGEHYENGVKYPGFHNVLAFNNPDIKIVYATDSYWDPASWILIDENSNIPDNLTVQSRHLIKPTIDGTPNPLIGSTQNLRHKKYYIVTNPTVEMYTSTSNSFYAPLNPTIERVYDKILNSDPIYITEINPDYDTSINYLSPETPLAYNEATKNWYWGNNRLNFSFTCICNDDTNIGTPWMVLGQSVVYFDNNIENITHAYPLPNDFIPTWNSGNSNAHFAASNRWKYKNRCVIAQSGTGVFAVYDLSNPDFSDPNYEIPHRKLIAHTDSLLDYGPHQFSFHNGSRYMSIICVNDHGEDMNYISTYNKSWMIDIGEGTFQEEEPTIYEFPDVKFIYPIYNTSLFIAITGTNNDGSKTVTIFNMDTYKSARENLETTNAALSDDDPNYLTANDIHEQAFLQSIVNRNADTNYTFEISAISSHTQPISGCVGFNEHVYVRFYDGINRRIWYYNITTRECVELLDINEGFKYMLQPMNMRNIYTSIFDSEEWCAVYHPCTLDNSTGHGVFVFEQPGGDSDSDYYGRRFYIIKESDPKNVVEMTRYLGSGYQYCCGICRFDIKTINDKELIMYLLPSNTVCHRAQGGQSATSIACWDIGLWLNGYKYYNCSNPETDFSFLSSTTPTRLPRIAYLYDSAYTNTLQDYAEIAGNNVMKDKMIMVNLTKHRLEIVPIHNFLPHELTGTTTTIQCYNNPKLVNLKHPLTVVFSNTGIGYKKSYFGVPDNQNNG